MRPGTVIVLLLLTASCAGVPKGQYTVEQIEWKGVSEMSDEALEACLASKERERVTLRLGMGKPTCGKPPFDQHVPEVSLWTWPWTEHVVHDAAIFEVDQKRIVRWFEARGFYQARVVGIRYSVDGEEIISPELCTTDDCELEIEFAIDEGKAVQVKSVILTGIEHPFPAALREELSAIPEMVPKTRWDETTFENDKTQLVELLKENGYARAEVKGHAEIDRERRLVRVRYEIIPGPICRFGRTRVEGNGRIEAYAITDVAGIEPGDRYQQSTLTDAERAVFDLGVFSSVRIEPDLEGKNDVIDLVVHVAPGRLQRWRIGIGVMSGTLQRATSDEVFSVPEWDIHLKVSYSNEDFLGGMRKFRIEDRPRLIARQSFPGIPDSWPLLGNALIVHFEQPRFIEPRTVLFSDGQWDLGPDSFYGHFRHDIATKLGLRRAFWRHRISAQVALQHDIYELVEALPDDPPPTISSYRLPFAEQQVRLDLRNDSVRPTLGLYIATTVQEAVRFDYGSWDYIRVLPELRAYEPLFWNIVLAQRIAFGALFIESADPDLDPTSAVVGPQSYRLRGGGANGNRGFAAGSLGVGVDGGNRRWEGSFEMRVPLGESLGVTLFFDVGDVSISDVRFNYLNASTGLGLRYYTAFAPIRFDMGWRIPGWQRTGADGEDAVEWGWPSALHLTLGEAF